MKNKSLGPKLGPLIGNIHFQMKQDSRVSVLTELHNSSSSRWKFNLMPNLISIYDSPPPSLHRIIILYMSKQLAYHTGYLNHNNKAKASDYFLPMQCLRACSETTLNSLPAFSFSELIRHYKGAEVACPSQGLDALHPWIYRLKYWTKRKHNNFPLYVGAHMILRRKLNSPWENS